MVQRTADTSKLTWWIMGIFATLFVLGVSIALNASCQALADMRSQVIRHGEQIVHNSTRIDSIETMLQRIDGKLDRLIMERQK